MSASLVVSVELLANNPHLIPVIGEMRWSEWGHFPEPEKLDWWIETTALEAGRDRLPVAGLRPTHHL